MGDTDASLQFLVDLSDHQSTINAVRFSPCGKMIATASDRQIIIYSLLAPDENTDTVPSWDTLTDPKLVSRLWLRPCLQEIYDLQWSPDSLYVVAGSIDSKVSG
jgi:chromatin assembly factor 1 subunit B